MDTEQIGRYQIEKKLGAGSMAVVYKAKDPVIGRTVAIKTIKIDSSAGFEQEELRQRLHHEAQSAGKLNHPNIVTIYDIGREGDVDYISMEFIEGEGLNEWMARNPIPPVEQTVSIIEQIASGLDYAAARGVIHRDIKPANILLTPDMTAKIADFGIAKIATSKFTQTGAVMGSPSYMSPEQAMGKTLDGRSDIFSLGVIFYEMLTGEKPFSGTNPTTIIYKILHEEPVSPKQLNVTLPPAFDKIVGRMLEKDPDKRYQSCSQLIQDLTNYQSLPVQEPEPSPPSVTVNEKSKGGSKRIAVLMLLVVAALAAVGGYYLVWKPRQVAQQKGVALRMTPLLPSIPETKPQKSNADLPLNPPLQAVPQNDKVEPEPQKTTDDISAGQKPSVTAVTSEGPSKSQPEPPSKNQAETPSKSQAEAPSKSQAETPSKSQPEPPSKNQAETPSKSQAETPSKSQAETPAKSQPETPSKSQPETPSKSQPETPAKSQPETPAKSQPEDQPSSKKVKQQAASGKEEVPNEPKAATTGSKLPGKKVVPIVEEPGQAEIRLAFAGATYPITVYDGTAPLKELSAENPSIQVDTGKHQFRLVSEDGLIEQKLPQVRLKKDEVYTISVPAICSAFIEVPNDAYDGCVIQLDGKTLAAPYPAQIPKMAAGNHKIVFRWNSGKYIGRELVYDFTGEANHHYRIRGEPGSEKVIVQQMR
jgi:serine/threonine protein kinase